MIKDLRLVEIELFSFCNRRCDWCPNREIDRYSTNEEVSDIVLYKLINELKHSGYAGALSFSRYNEPMSHIEIFKSRLQMIKTALPINKLVTNTNGDYLSRENLKGLLIDELSIMDYDHIGVKKCIERLERVGVEIDEVSYPYIYGHFEGMQILYFVDWKDNRKITDRGGLLKEYTQDARENPCFEPIYFVGINYDGTVSPCCNIRNEIDSLKPYVLGSLYNSTLDSLLSSKKYIQFRNRCLSGRFSEGTPCYTCANNGGRYTQGRNGIRYE